MDNSDRASFMTAEQDSPRVSVQLARKATPYYPQRQPPHRNEAYSTLKSIPSSPSVLSDRTGHTVIHPPSQTMYDLESIEKPHRHFTEPVPIPTPELKTYPIAWLLLFFIVVLRAAVSIYANTFSPIPQVTADFMGISLSNINWLYNIMAIVYIFASFFTSYLYQLIGVKWSLFLSGCILSSGCWIRWVSVKIHPPSFPVLMIGQALASFSAPISLNLTTLFSTLWFTDNKRATAGMFIVSNYGTIIAMFLMPAIATGKDKIEQTIIIVACIATAATVPFLFFPAKPRTPASNIAITKTTISLRQGTIMLLKNKHFLILLVVHSLNIGLSVAWGGLMNQAISPYGYSDNQIGNISAVGVVGGTLGCLISGPVIDRTKLHKLFLKIMAPLMCSTYVAFIFIIKRGSFGAIIYTYILNQFFLSFMVPICVELGVEVSYPVTESLSTSILWQAAQAIGFVLVLVMDLFRDENGEPKNNMFRALIFQAAVSGICLIFALLFNGPMSRTEALKESEQMYDSNDTETLHVINQNEK